jgi:hypothetical protein
MINSAPKIAKPAVDFYKRLIHMPAPLRIAAHMGDAPLSDLRGEHWSETVPPEPDGLMADFDPALGQQILDVAKRQRVSHVQHHNQTDDFRRAVEIRNGLVMRQTITPEAIQISSDKARESFA